MGNCSIYKYYIKYYTLNGCIVVFNCNTTLQPALLNITTLTKDLFQLFPFSIVLCQVHPHIPETHTTSSLQYFFYLPFLHDDRRSLCHFITAQQSPLILDTYPASSISAFLWTVAINMSSVFIIVECQQSLLVITRILLSILCQNYLLE